MIKKPPQLRGFFVCLGIVLALGKFAAFTLWAGY